MTVPSGDCTLPELLRPTGVERFFLPDGSTADIDRALPHFPPWLGSPIEDDYGSKPVLEWRGEPLFAELLILRLLESAGWEGVWVDTFRRRFWRAVAEPIELPTRQAALLRCIREKARTSGGCFDVFAWQDSQWLFAEAKWAGHDRVRDTQRRWLNAALDQQIPGASFLVIEWSVG